MRQHTVTHPVHVPCYMTDRYNRLTPSAFMDLAQDVAGDHSNRFGFGHFDLIGDRLVWIISRMHFHFLKTPLWEDDVRITTWHNGCEDGLFFRREFLLEKEDGTPMVQGTSGWLLLNVDTRELVRSHPLCDRPETICPDHVLPQPSPRLRLPRGLQPAAQFEHVVRHSDIDRNFHANNAKYAVWTMDVMPQEMVNVPLNDFSINFLHECREGDAVAVRRYDIAPGRCMVEGSAAGRQIFLTDVVYDLSDPSITESR